MGNSSNSSANYGNDKFSYHCECGCDKRYCYSQTIATKSYHLPGDAGLTVGRAFAGIFTLGLSEAGYGIYKGATNSGDGLNHYFVEVDYRCETCHSNFTKTYEWFSNAYNEIMQRCGYYPNYDNNRRRMNKRISYRTIESKFQDSRSYNYENCQQYANKFYDKLSDY